MPPPALRRHLPLLCLATALVAAPAVLAEPGAESLRFEEGLAHAPADGRELYREQHWLRSREDRLVERLVLYRCLDGTPFARKRVDYRGSAQAPAFALEDVRSDYREGLRRTGATPEVFVRERGGATRSARVPASVGLVADAGFDEFIRARWAPLVAGQRLPLQFAVPARLRSLPFSLQRVRAAQVGRERAHVFQLRLDGLLGLVGPRIEVSYGERSRRLLRFEGLSNLRDDRGHSQLQARVEFPQPSRDASEAEWARAASQPLAACATGRRADAADTADARSVAIN